MSRPRSAAFAIVYPAFRYTRANRSLPPLECAFGVIPIQAARSRPVRRLLRTVAAMMGTTPVEQRIIISGCQTPKPAPMPKTPRLAQARCDLRRGRAAMTLAAVDRLVHHATIFEMNVESYRRRSVLEVKRQRGRPASFATIKGRPVCQISPCLPLRTRASASTPRRTLHLRNQLSNRLAPHYHGRIGIAGLRAFEKVGQPHLLFWRDG